MTLIEDTAVVIFLVTVVATFAASLMARSHRKKLGSDQPTDQKLNKWLVGLSAGATANSGFIVTAAVGLGYMYGLQWILLPLAWLLGDLVFWSKFPEKINRIGRKTGAATLTAFIAHNIEGRFRNAVIFLVGLSIVVCLLGYISAQWIAGQKFLNGVFDFGPFISMTLFAVIIIGYSTIGGFRGSIYADSLQAVFRIVGTIVAVVVICHTALTNQDVFQKNIGLAGPNFLELFGFGGFATTLGFVLGFAFAAFGFGLGQPQIITRYLAGKDETETKAAKWIYIGFVQFTWIAMTMFGVLLRGVMPGIEDPEQGLGLFFSQNFGAILTGIIVADIFATIAATTNSLLIATAQSVKHDLTEKLLNNPTNPPLWAIVACLGAVSMIASMQLDSSVLSLAITSASLLGAALAPTVVVIALDLKRNSGSILASIIVGIVAAVAWKFAGLGQFVNEAAPGIILGFVSNIIVYKLSSFPSNGKVGRPGCS